MRAEISVYKPLKCCFKGRNIGVYANVLCELNADDFPLSNTI